MRRTPIGSCRGRAHRSARRSCHRGWVGSAAWPWTPSRSGARSSSGPARPRPDAWDGCERVVVDAVDTDVADHLGEAWRERRPVVVELHPGLGLDDPATPPPEVVTGASRGSSTSSSTSSASASHHAIWANTDRWSGVAAEPRRPPRRRARRRAARRHARGVRRRPARHRARQPARRRRRPAPHRARARLALPARPQHHHRRAGARPARRRHPPRRRGAHHRPRRLGQDPRPHRAGPHAAAIVGPADRRPRRRGVQPAGGRRAARRAPRDLAGLRIRTLNALGPATPPRRHPHRRRAPGPRRTSASWSTSAGGPRPTRRRRGWRRWAGCASACARPTRSRPSSTTSAASTDVGRGYRDRLRAAGEADFDEQVVGAIERLLADPPSAGGPSGSPGCCWSTSSRTSPPPTCSSSACSPVRPASVFGVGDDDQTIYGYAGATPDWLVRFGEVFPGSGAHPLEVNYRCPPAVVTAAANLLTRNAVRVPKVIRPAPGAPDEPGRAGGGRRPATTPPAHRRPRHRRWSTGGALPAEVAVLARVNASLAPVQVLLRHQGVPVRGGVDARFLSRGGVRAASPGSRWPARPSGRCPAPALREAARRPKRGLGDRLLGWISRAALGRRAPAPVEPHLQPSATPPRCSTSPATSPGCGPPPSRATPRRSSTWSATRSAVAGSMPAPPPSTAGATAPSAPTPTTSTPSPPSPTSSPTPPASRRGCATRCRWATTRAASRWRRSTP